jgi:hypothetical protein
VVAQEQVVALELQQTCESALLKFGSYALFYSGQLDKKKKKDQCHALLT